MKKHALIMFLAMSTFAAAMPATAMAEEIVSTETDVIEVTEGDVTEDEEVIENTVPDRDAEAAAASDDSEIMLEEDSSEDENVPSVDLTQVAVGSSTYVYVDLTNVEDAENVEYKHSVQGRGGVTVTTYSFSDLTQLEGTNYYYRVTAGTDLIGETVYAFTGNVADSTSYTDFYSSLGVTADSEDYDIISSATNYTGYHAKDISGTVTYGTNDDGNKVITGISTGRELEEVDGTSYVTAKILSADGKELTAEQTALVEKKLKQNPTVQSSEVKQVSLSSAAYTTSRYGIGEFAIVPDDTVDGYVWSEYWDNVYGATVSDGTTTTGAVHWIDLYGEAATSGPHYNKIELAINDGTSTASNAAQVSRYKEFVEEGALKPGKYTITVYADGYENLTATVINSGESKVALADQTVTYSGNAVSMEAEVQGSSASVTYTYYADAACTEELAAAPVDAGTYYVIASVASDEVYGEASSDPAKLVIEKASSAISLKPLTTAYTGKAKSIGKASVKGSSGRITYTYYSDSACKKALKAAPVNAGTYYVKASVASDTNYKSKTSTAVKLVIEPKAASIKVKTAKASYTASTVNKAKKTFSMGASVDSKGKLYFKKTSGSSGLTVDKNGRITIEKGSKKGTYTAKIKIKSAATSNYKAAVKYVTIKVVVK